MLRSFFHKNKIPQDTPYQTDEVAERLTDMGKNAQTFDKHVTKKTKLLANEDVLRWYNSLSRGSVNTAEERLRRLGKFCEDHQMTPMSLVDLAKRDLKTLTDTVEDYVTMMESKKYAPGYIDNYVKAIKSWLRHFDLEIKRKIKVSFRQSTPTLKDEQVPNAEQMSEIYSRANLREAVIVSLMAKSGLRPEVLGNHNGTDGLRLRDLPDIVVHQDVVKCLRMPCMVIVRPELSKARHRYFTFCTAIGTSHIIAYLNDRLTRGESLNADTPVISPRHEDRSKRNRTSGKEFLPSKQISKRIRETFRPRFKWRPYVLRAYFDTQLLVAESQGKIAHDFRVFFMGHKGSMEARYTTNKGILAETLMAEMQQGYTRSEPYLDQVHVDPHLDQKQEVHGMVEKATPEQLGLVLEALCAGKTDQVRR